MHQQTIQNLPSLNRMTDIYAKAIQIRLFAERLMNRSIQLERLAINTEIVAVKATKMGKPFTVIAKEVSSLARMITSQMGDLLDCSARLAKQAVSSAAGARKCEKYEQALTLGISGSNQQIMLQSLGKSGDELLAMLEEMRGGLNIAHSNARNLTRLSVHIPVVASMFRIESARGDRSSSGIFKGMSQELVNFAQFFTSDLESLLQTTNLTLSLFQNKKGAARLCRS